MKDNKLENMCKMYKDVFSLILRDETTGLFLDLLTYDRNKHIDSFEEAFNYYTSIYFMNESEAKLTNLDKRYSSFTYFFTESSKLGKMTSKSMLKKIMSTHPLNKEYLKFDDDE